MHFPNPADCLQPPVECTTRDVCSIASTVTLTSTGNSYKYITSALFAHKGYLYTQDSGLTLSFLHRKLRAAVTAVLSDPCDETFSITTAINYANGAPHMGHAYEAVSSDVIARYHRAYGRKVLFQTGSDEHGQKIAEAAEVAGCAPIDLCDKHVLLFQTLNEKIQISNDVYNRTTSDAHKKACAALLRGPRTPGTFTWTRTRGGTTCAKRLSLPKTTRR